MARYTAVTIQTHNTDILIVCAKCLKATKTAKHHAADEYNGFKNNFLALAACIFNRNLSSADALEALGIIPGEEKKNRRNYLHDSYSSCRPKQ